jgi:anti-anti-sigma regulatory factor
MSFDGAIDCDNGQALRSQLCELLNLGLRPIFLDLSGAESVDAGSLCHLIETLDYAQSFGRVVAVFEESEVLSGYFQSMRYITVREHTRAREMRILNRNSGAALDQSSR